MYPSSSLGNLKIFKSLVVVAFQDAFPQAIVKQEELPSSNRLQIQIPVKVVLLYILTGMVANPIPATLRSTCRMTGHRHISGLRTKHRLVDRRTTNRSADSRPSAKHTVGQDKSYVFCIAREIVIVIFRS